MRFGAFREEMKKMHLCFRKWQMKVTIKRRAVHDRVSMYVAQMVHY